MADINVTTVMILDGEPEKRAIVMQCLDSGSEAVDLSSAINVSLHIRSDPRGNWVSMPGRTRPDGKLQMEAMIYSPQEYGVRATFDYAGRSWHTTEVQFDPSM